jgi:hypothetical protein
MLSRIEFVILRTDRSPPAAPHHASLRRSCSWLQAGERLPEEDFHLSDHLRFQAHECGNLLPLFKLSQLHDCLKRAAKRHSKSADKAAHSKDLNLLGVQRLVATFQKALPLNIIYNIRCAIFL